MSISKVKQIRLETTAQYQPISDLNVRFFNQDINTSVLDFIVTRNNDPIPLGIDNIEATIVLTSNKFKISDEVKIKDGLNGILTYTLPDDILERHGKVTGQIYIGIKGKEDTVVQRLFSFDIEDSLINSFDAETKLVYIRKFDKLEEQISQRVESIEQAIAHSEDYVTKIIEEKDIALSQIDERKINILEEMTTLFDTEKSNLQAIGEGYKTNLEQVDVELNQKIADIKEEINPETYVTQIQSDNWQKYKMTNDDGTRKTKSNIDILTLDTGFYEIRKCTNTPLNDTGIYNLIVFGKNGRKFILATQIYENRTFVNTIHNDGDVRGWKEITLPFKSSDAESVHGSQEKADKVSKEIKEYIDKQVYDTGWQPLTVMSNVSTHDSAGASMYRVINNVCEIRFNIGIDKWTNELPIIQPPENAKPTSGFSFLARTNGSSGKNPAVISYDRGKSYFKVWTNGDNSLNTGDYIYGHVVYMVGGSLNV